MEGPSLLYLIISNLIGTGIFSAVIFFILKKWVGTKIEASVKSKYSKELEDHKAQLQRQLQTHIRADQFFRERIKDVHYKDFPFFG